MENSNDRLGEVLKWVESELTAPRAHDWDQNIPIARHDLETLTKAILTLQVKLQNLSCIEVVPVFENGVVIGWMRRDHHPEDTRYIVVERAQEVKITAVNVFEEIQKREGASTNGEQQV